ncbi:hypothetical protein DEO72_LG4g945 [Vigna unguiculata]|uniref:Uncharacterized protein n=1 Tax=Vigna unguiculata TaxID=3917 RepID=A0A4D6LND1_VIGUN|nr:hypothetical protein DEO72_LG4g945 [Vigna unguiculata]
MNLPAHGTASPDSSKASLLVKNNTQKARNNSVSAWLGPHAARRNCSRPPGGTCTPPGANALPAPLFIQHRLAEHFLTARHRAVQRSSLLFLSPGGTSSPPGATPEMSLCWFWHAH